MAKLPMSERLYKGLSKSQHKKNNDWFELMFQLANDGACLGLSHIGVVLQKTSSGWIELKKGGAK